MRLIALAIVSWFSFPVTAQDQGLAALHATLVKLRSYPPEGPWTYGARPELTLAKHQLRDWIEERLRSLQDSADLDAFSADINKAVQSAAIAGAGEGDLNNLGSLGPVRMRRTSALLTVITSVGIVCQQDHSAYVYRRGAGGWQRIWESEQNNYAKYTPQDILDVHILQPYKNGSEDGPPFVMTLGNEWGCASSWHLVYYRVWRIDPGGAKLLIDRSELAWLRAERYLVGSIVQSRDKTRAGVDVLVEFTQRGIDTMVHHREAIHHFVVEGDRVRRVQPVALGPRDFVDEWLRSPWQAASDWSASAALQTFHDKLQATANSGMYWKGTRQCRSPELWQVTLGPDFGAGDARVADVHFLVRWRPPYHFTLVDAARKPWPRCDREDPAADEWRTLFAIQGWRE